MRISLVNEATYPVHGGGVSEWCHHMVSTSTAEFTVTTVVGDTTPPRYEVPPSVISTHQLAMWPHLRPRTRISRDRRRALEPLIMRLCTAMLPVHWESDPTAARADTPLIRGLLQELTQPEPTPLAPHLRHETFVQGLLAAPGWGSRPVLEAVEPARTLCQLIGVLDRSLAPALALSDVVHATCNGVAGAVAMVHADARNTPFLLTEHGVYLRERYIDMSQRPQLPAGAAVSSHLWSVLARCVYDAASLVTSVAQANFPWLHAFGVEPERFRTIHNGVNPQDYPVLPEPGGIPTVVWVGRFGPMKDLRTLVEAMVHVQARIPTAKLVLCGPPDEGGTYAAHVRELVGERGLLGVVEFPGAVDNSVQAYRRGHVVALSSITEGLPFTVMEALMCGRPTVSTDVGGVHEIVGTDGVAGLLVPPASPLALADALITLLSDAERRASMGRSARERALTLFTHDRCLDTYHRVYADLAVTARGAHASPPVPASSTRLHTPTISGATA